jgi:hypothetical protein
MSPTANSSTDAISRAFPGIHILEQTPVTLRNCLAHASTDDLDWRPSPDRWSISMVLAHLADVEVKGFVSRFRAMSEQDGAFLPAYDQLTYFQSGPIIDGRAKLHEFERLRSENLAWLGSLPASILSRRGNHQEVGEVTFGELLHEFVFHDLGHIRQVMELYRTHAFYPKMGGFQKYYAADPQKGSTKV